MPTIAEFGGMKIAMFSRDHPPPHIHATYGGDEAVIAVQDARLLRGTLPPRQLRLVRQWMSMNRQALEENWRRAAAREPLVPIGPFR